jgi:nucleotide-binding universal stress UspA family protein
MKANDTLKDVYEVSGAVVVGVDGSNSSLEALEWAAEQTRLTGQPLIAIITWEWPASYGASDGWVGDVDFEEDARNILRDSVAKSFGDEGALRVTQKVIHGHSPQVLVDASKNASLLVVGSRGHGEFAGMLLGSVSEFLATHAKCPVVIVRHCDPRD